MADHYKTHGNAAYRMTPDGTAAIEPTRTVDRSALVKERRRARDSARRQAMAKYRVRQQQAVAPLAIVGFLAVAVMAVFVLRYYVQLNALNKQVVQVSSQLTTLQEQEKTLTATYEQMIDLQEIEDRMVNSGAMVKPDSTQIIYLELAEPDSATVYQETEGPFAGLWKRLSGMVYSQ
jgi:hypothetical protein